MISGTMRLETSIMCYTSLLWKLNVRILDLMSVIEVPPQYVLICASKIIIHCTLVRARRHKQQRELYQVRSVQNFNAVKGQLY